MRKKCFSDQEKFLKFEAEDQEFLRLLEQFIQTVTGQNFGKRMLFNLFLEVSHTPILRITLILVTGKNRVT